MNGYCYTKLKESGKNLYLFVEYDTVPNIVETDIVLGDTDIVICHVLSTNTNYIYFLSDNTWVQWNFYRNEIEKTIEGSFCKDEKVDNISANLESLLFEIYSAGFKAGMSNKDIVNSYNDFYNDILRRISN